MTIKIGFTGTQIGMSYSQKAALHGALVSAYEPDAEFHHGDCIRADAEAHTIARLNGYRIVLHPPEVTAKRAFCDAEAYEVRRPYAYLVRNRHIVDGTQRMIATPKGAEELRSGTWSTIRYAKKLDRPLLILMP